MVHLPGCLQHHTCAMVHTMVTSLMEKLLVFFFNLGPSLVSFTRHFDWTKGISLVPIYSITALRHLTLCIIPPHTSFHLNKISYSHQIPLVQNLTGLCNRIHCVMLSCVVRCVCLCVRSPGDLTHSRS